MAIQIKCINKDNGNHENPHEAIQSYGWVNDADASSGKSNRVAMVKFLEDGGSAYVRDQFRNVAHCVVRTSSSGNKFLQTVSDGKYSDNLLSLPECV